MYLDLFICALLLWAIFSGWRNGFIKEIFSTIGVILGLVLAAVLYYYFSDTIFPEGLEFAPPRFAISRRNEWMLKQADFVVTYITHSWGGAAQFAEKAQRQGKNLIHLAEKGPVRGSS